MTEKVVLVSRFIFDVADAQTINLGTVNLLVPIGEDYIYSFPANLTLGDEFLEIQRKLTVWVNEKETVFFSIANLKSTDGEIEFECQLARSSVHGFAILTYYEERDTSQDASGKMLYGMQVNLMSNQIRIPRSTSITTESQVGDNSNSPFTDKITKEPENSKETGKPNQLVMISIQTLNIINVFKVVICEKSMFH